MFGPIFCAFVVEVKSKWLQVIFRKLLKNINYVLWISDFDGNVGEDEREKELKTRECTEKKLTLGKNDRKGWKFGKDCTNKSDKSK